jgi:hypothetical protein
MSKPIDVESAEAILNLVAVHGVAQVLGYISDHYASLPEGFEKSMPNCMRLAGSLEGLKGVAERADAEVEAG